MRFCFLWPSKTWPDAARPLSIASIAHAKSLEIFPQRGRLRPEFGPGIRSIPVSPVVAFYRVIDEDAENGATVEVLRIIDGRRDLRTVFFTG